MKFKVFLDENQFDSDGVEQDVEDAADSNISQVISSEIAIEAISKIIKDIQCMLIHLSVSWFLV